MKEQDFLVCSFKGDETSYVAEITDVHNGSFDCRFVHSEKSYSFSSGNWVVEKSTGGFPPGTPLTKHQLFTPREGEADLNNIVRVTFANGKAYLGVLFNKDPMTVVFLHGVRPTYVFDNNVVTLSGGAYKVGETIKGITLFAPVDGVAGTVLPPQGSTTGTGGGPAGASIAEYDQLRDDTLVSNAVEFPSNIAGFHNFKGWKASISVPHNRRPKKVRALSDTIHLVLHETAADTGDGFDDSHDTTSHFSVLKDGRLLQFNDLAEKQYHVGVFNDTSVGIEFVNKGWIQGMPSKESGLNATQRQTYSEDKGYLWAFCGLGQNVYRLPSIDQLEKLLELMNRFLDATDDGLPRFAGEWLQLVSYNDVKDVWDFVGDSHVPAESAVKRFFIFSNADQYLTPSNMAGRPGIFSHASISSITKDKPDNDAHSDGSFLALYSWLRIARRFKEEEAYSLARKLVKTHHFFARTKEKFMSRSGTSEARLIIVLDVDDSHLIV